VGFNHEHTPLPPPLLRAYRQFVIGTDGSEEVQNAPKNKHGPAAIFRPAVTGIPLPEFRHPSFEIVFANAGIANELRKRFCVSVQQFATQPQKTYRLCLQFIVLAKMQPVWRPISSINPLYQR
jgi:hypothetical protein